MNLPRRSTLQRALMCALLLGFGSLLWPSTRAAPSPDANEVVASPLAVAAAITLPVASRDGGLAGTVTTHDGNARAGVRVCATCMDCERLGTQDLVCDETDESGAYLLSGLGTNGYTVTAHAPGFALVSAADGRVFHVKPGTRIDSVDIVLGERGNRVRGRVLDAFGGEIAHANVRIIGQGPAQLSTALETRADGSFDVYVGSNYLTVAAAMQGYAPERTYHVAPSDDLTLVLTPESVISGFVLSEDEQRPLAGARVSAQSVDRGGVGHGTAISLQDGSFRVEGLRPGRYVLQASAAGYRGEGQDEYEVRLGDSLHGVQLLVGRAAQVRGRVLIEQAGPPRPCPSGFVMLGAPHPALALRDPKWTDEAISTIPRAPTNVLALIGADGRVTFDAVPKGVYFASVECTGHLQHAGPDVVEVGASDLDGLEFRVMPSARVAIRVLDERDAPIANARVTLKWPGGSRSTGLESGADGWTHAITHLYPGSYTATLTGGFQAQPVTFDVRPGARDVSALVHVQGDAGLEVLVSDPHGAAVDAVRVAATGCAASASDQRPNEPRRAATLNALGLGRFRSAPIAAGCYEVEVRDASRSARVAAPERIELRSGQIQQLQVVLDRGAVLEGHVRADDGSPAPNVWVSVAAAAREISRFEREKQHALMYSANRVLTDQDGRFRVADLTHDVRYDVSAEAENGTTAVVRNVEAGSELTISLPAAGAIDGVVTDERGRPLDEFAIEVLEVETQRTESLAFARTAGRFNLWGLTPGRLEILARDGSGRRARLDAELRPGQRLSHLQLELPPPTAAHAEL